MKTQNLIEVKGIVNKYVYAVLRAIITYVLFVFSRARNIKYLSTNLKQGPGLNLGGSRQKNGLVSMESNMSIDS